MSDIPDWMLSASDAGSGSDFGTTGYFGGYTSISDAPIGAFTQGNPELDEPSNLSQEELRVIKDVTGLGSGDISYDLGSIDFSDITKAGKQLYEFFSQKENKWLLNLLGGGLGAIIGAMDKQPPTGGGTTTAYAPKTRYVRTIEQSPTGPYAKHTRVPRTAADGGIMQAYRSGGQVKPFPMQDGGFVMTKKAVDGAGGPRGLASLVPETRMIGGPPDPTGRKDLTPAFIQGANGRTPARVSRGEAYIPPGRDTRQLYALMRALERKA